MGVTGAIRIGSRAPELCPVSYDDGILRISRSGKPAVLTMAGEIDEHNFPGLVAALDEFGSREREVRVNLGGITYCDLAGLRAILRLAGDADCGQDTTGRLLILQQVPQELKKIMGILGWDSTPGLVMDDSAQIVDFPGRAG
jgi:ABC-type transporter Mla MlaB component